MTGNRADGNRADLESLFLAERVPMVKLATLMVGSRAIAEEVVQDAFATVGERWDGLDRPGAYLRTAVVNGCAQTLRRRSVENRHRSVRLENSDEIPIRLIELRSALDRPIPPAGSKTATANNPRIPIALIALPGLAAALQTRRQP